jgi:hypothetical protein
MHRWQLAACLALLALGVIACGILREPADPVIDGWPVGSEISCADVDCELLLGLGRDHLDRRDPGHAVVVRATLHREGTLVEIDPASGGQILRTRSGGAPSIAVFELADGTLTAIGVGYPGISREPVVLGP